MVVTDDEEDVACSVEVTVVAIVRSCWEGKEDGRERDSLNVARVAALAGETRAAVETIAAPSHVAGTHAERETRD